MAIEIRALTPDLLPQFLTFFDCDAFADNPKWQYCYCNFLHHPPEQGPFNKTAPEANRAAVSDRICARAMHGWMAFDAGRIVGWCQAAPRQSILLLRDEPDPDNAAAHTGSIVCFVIEKAHRRKGLARRLLEAACEGFRAQGLKFAEAYPRKSAEGEGQNHFGPLAMYLAAGFAEFRNDDDTIIVRKALA